jgi:hypothetical protein
MLAIILISLISISRAVIYEYPTSVRAYPYEEMVNIENAYLDVPIRENGDLVVKHDEYLYIMSRKNFDPLDVYNYQNYMLHKKQLYQPFADEIIV